jgi:hypothetical protein
VRWGVVVQSFHAARFRSVHVNQSGYSSEKSGTQRKCSLVCGRRLAQNSREFQSQQGVLRAARKAGRLVSHRAGNTRMDACGALSSTTILLQISRCPGKMPLLKGKRWCPGWESNPHEEKSPEDFKSSASAIPPPGRRPFQSSEYERLAQHERRERKSGPGGKDQHLQGAVIAAGHDEIAGFGIVAHGLGAGTRDDSLDQAVSVRRILVENENFAIARGNVRDARGAAAAATSPC